MALLSKEDEMRYLNKLIFKKLKQLFHYKKILETACPELIPLFSQLLLICSEDEMVSPVIMGTIMMIFMKIYNKPELRYINLEMGVNENFFISCAMEDICVLRDENIFYRRHINEIAKAYGIGVVTESQGKYVISRDGITHNFGRIFSIKSVRSIPEYQYYKKICEKKYEDSCHGFNSSFYFSFPNATFVTGNIGGLFNDLFVAHSWIETEKSAISPNLNFYQSIEDYKKLSLQRDCVRIPFKKLEEDYKIILEKDPKMEYYDYLRNPEETMARLK